MSKQMCRGLVIVALASAWAPAVAQETGRLTFEVASIRPNVGPAGVGRRGVLRGGRYEQINVNVSELLSSAHPGIRPTSLDILGPDWIFRERYDVIATAGRDATVAEMRLMIRALLEDRFRLRARLERQEQPIWELVVARADKRLGPSLTPYPFVCGQTDAPACGLSASRAGIKAVGMPVSRLATFFTASVGRRVVDRTGLTGSYTFTLVYRPENALPPEPGSPPDERPTVFQALQDQLGLKLVSARGLVDVLIVDAVERPSGN